MGLKKLSEAQGNMTFKSTVIVQVRVHEVICEGKKKTRDNVDDFKFEPNRSNSCLSLHESITYIVLYVSSEQKFPQVANRKRLGYAHALIIQMILKGGHVQKCLLLLQIKYRVWNLKSTAGDTEKKTKTLVISALV